MSQGPIEYKVFAARFTVGEPPKGLRGRVPFAPEAGQRPLGDEPAARREARLAAVSGGPAAAAAAPVVTKADSDLSAAAVRLALGRARKAAAALPPPTLAKRQMVQQVRLARAAAIAGGAW